MKLVEVERNMTLYYDRRNDLQAKVTDGKDTEYDENNEVRSFKFKKIIVDAVLLIWSADVAMWIENINCSRNKFQDKSSLS